jgi:hypothetical protein
VVTKEPTTETVHVSSATPVDGPDASTEPTDVAGLPPAAPIEPAVKAPQTVEPVVFKPMSLLERKQRLLAMMKK